MNHSMLPLCPPPPYSSWCHCSMTDHLIALRTTPSRALRPYKPFFYYFPLAFGGPRRFYKTLCPCKASLPC